MRRLAQVNKIPVQYSLPESVQMETDENGLLTGNKIVAYGDKQTYYCYMSPSRGKADLYMFGDQEDYDATLVCESDCPFVEGTRLWIRNTHNAYNWIVVRKAETISHIIYAIKEVSVSWQSLLTQQK